MTTVDREVTGAQSRFRVSTEALRVYTMVMAVIGGALQGALVAYLNIPSFIVTLGGLLTWRGVILYLSKGETIPVRLPVFRLLGVALLTKGSGMAIAIVAIVAVIWLAVRRDRA